MGYKKGRFQSKTHTTSVFGLNITSMTDMFTILLVFLLQSYSTSEVEIKMENGIRMPSSSSFTNPVNSLQLSLSGKELKMDGKVLATLNGSEFTKSDIDPNDTNFILPLFRELDRIAKDVEARDKAGTLDKKEAYLKEGSLLLMADQALPYNVLRKVMYTASMAGFPKLKMATMMGE